MDDAKLAALLAQGALPAQDFSFTLAVMARIEKRQFRQAMLRNVALGAAGSLLLIPLAPILNNILRQISAPLSSNLVIAALLLATAVAALPWIAQRD